MVQKHVLSMNHAKFMQCDRDGLELNQIGWIFWGNQTFDNNSLIIIIFSINEVILFQILLQSFADCLWSDITIWINFGYE